MCAVCYSCNARTPNTPISNIMGSGELWHTTPDGCPPSHIRFTPGGRCHRRLQRKVYACGARERESAVIHINLNHALKSQFDWAPPRVPLHLVAARRFDPPPCYRQAATSACRAFIVRATQPVGCVRVLGETKVAQWGALEIREHAHACTVGL